MDTSIESVLRLVSAVKRQLKRAAAIFLATWVAVSALPLSQPGRFVSDPSASTWFSYSLADWLLRGAEIRFLPRGETIIALGPWDTFAVLMEIGAAVAVLALIPYITVEAYRHKSALRRKERQALRFLLPLSLGLFVSGLALSAWLLPWLYAFAYSVQAPAGVSGTVSLTAFVTETALFMVGLGVAFETPVVTYGLGYLGILTTGVMRKNLKWAFLACTIAALFVSPGVGGGIIEIPLAFGLFGLYLLGYLMVRSVERSRAESEAAITTGAAS